MKLLGLPRLALCSAPAALTLLAASAHAEEPRKVTEPYVMNEAASMVSVADAFDEGDVFDLHLSLGYRQSWTSGNILRESHNTTPSFSSGGYTAGNMAVAKYSESTGRLIPRADIGLYKDIAVVLRMPIILSNTRELKSLDGSADHASVVAMGAPGEQLFAIPFQSPTRSGIEYLAAGMDFGIFNQARDSTKPTWVFGAEGRFSITEPMHACQKSASSLNQAGSQVDCADPSDVNRNGQPNTADPQLEGLTFSGSRNPGVSRGTTALQVHTYLSRRVKYVEPYGGFQALFEFQNSNSDFGKTSLQGSLVNHPPFRGTMLGGMSVYPWEVRDKYQRIEIDFRAAGTYVSEGRDYSPLFDALGSSDARSLRNPNYAAFKDSGLGPNSEYPSEVNTQSQKVYVTGITDVQQHGVYTLSTQVTFQAGEYVKFNAGGAYTIQQGHLITFDQPCNPDFNNDPTKAGPCRSRTGTNSFNATGIPNPNYRPSINVPGRRFVLDDTTTFSVWLNATVMF